MADFRGFDMLAEPPGPPEWLERWYRDAGPQPTTVAMFARAFEAEMRGMWDDISALEVRLFSGIAREYRTPPEIDRRARQRALDREAPVTVRRRNHVSRALQALHREARS